MGIRDVLKIRCAQQMKTYTIYINKTPISLNLNPQPFVHIKSRYEQKKTHESIKYGIKSCENFRKKPLKIEIPLLKKTSN